MALRSRSAVEDVPFSGDMGGTVRKDAAQSLFHWQLSIVHELLKFCGYVSTKVEGKGDCDFIAQHVGAGGLDIYDADSKRGLARWASLDREDREMMKVRRRECVDWLLEFLDGNTEYGKLTPMQLHEWAQLAHIHDLEAPPDAVASGGGEAGDSAASQALQDWHAVLKQCAAMLQVAQLPRFPEPRRLLGQAHA